ncbi:MAG TPA: hypothetical protein VK108_03645 [Pseudogracilibacillus sp.]|nr:hypothetical protein [Pseudogracilibacillus sp.]
MNLINVRKGQFVYYKNQLHKVYSVKPFFKHSVHLIRLSDLEQEIVQAKDITYYLPKHLDSFIVNHQRYTLDKNIRAKIGDYILVINPKPDSLDHHHLHAIELVTSLEDNGVISNKSNGIKHNEYWTMTVGLLDDATKIDKQHPETDGSIIETADDEGPLHPDLREPKIGDVYQKNDSDPVFQAMVIAIQDRDIYLGGDIKVASEDLTDTDQWSYIVNPREQ